MPNFYTQLFFQDPINVSVQVGDVAYYCTYDQTGGFNVNVSSIVEIGKVVNFPTENSILCEFDSLCNNCIPTTEHFIMFAKDNKANLSSILGYYAEVKMVNDSTEKGKLYSIGSEVVESSK